jgi:S1-C subfamily serine protease
MRHARHILVAASLATLGCGSASVATGPVTETSLDQGAEAMPAPAQRICTDSDFAIGRAALEEVLSAGPAGVLASVQTDSVVDDGKFVGFRIVSFRVEVDPCLDLREEDVLTRVNGRVIERPEHYFEVFEALRTAKEIRFDLLRDGEPVTLTYPVTE